MEQGEPQVKRFKHSIISEHIFQPNFQETFYKHWHNGSPVRTNNLEIIVEPFRVCRISNFLKNEELMDEIKTELLDVKSRRNSIDLYQFEQTNDLSTVDSFMLKKLYEIFQTDMVDWMEKNTDILLNNNLSMSSSCYTDTDYLLCHDDNLDDRRIAFILYLSENWTEEDGGALDLFDTNEKGLPRNVVKSLVPEYNSLVFFEVVHNSYHQVAEVTSPDKSRWSINGWFHGPLPEIERPLRSGISVRYLEPESTEVDLSLWVSSIYLHPKIIEDINLNVEQDSFAFLSDFFESEIYQSISEEVESDDIKWKKVGPADYRNYEVADENSLTKSLADFCNIFKSIALFRLLKKYTHLDLVPERVDMHPKMSIELQRWSKGCYILIDDKASPEEVDPDRNGVSSANGCDSDVVENTDNSNLTKVLRIQNNFNEESGSSGIKISEEVVCQTPPSSTGDDDLEDDELVKSNFTEKSPKSKQKVVKTESKVSSPSKADVIPKRRNLNSDTDDSDVSDIGDYLSDDPPLDCSFEEREEEVEAQAEEGEAEAEAEGEDEAEEEEEEEEIEEQQGSLDVIIQFHTNKILDNETIDYIDPGEEEGALIHIPAKDNHLCLVYKTLGTCFVRKHVNHYCKGYFYNLVCTYCE